MIAREKSIPGISGELIANVAKSIGHEAVYWIKDKNEITKKLLSILDDNDFIITMGAGDIYKISDQILKILNDNYARD